MAVEQKNHKMVTNNNQSTSTTKNATPLYISNALFHNKRLKQKRLKLARKTERQLEPTITINLLSDEDENTVEEPSPQQLQLCYEALKPLLMKPITATEPPPLVPLTPAAKVNSLQPLIVYHQQDNQTPGVPHIALIPMHQIPVALQEALPTVNVISPPKKRRTRRKVQQIVTPKIVNVESIILSDSDEEKNSTTLNTLPELTLTVINQQQKVPKQPQNEEEVTVSLVPRCSSASSIASNSTSIVQQLQTQTPQVDNKKQLFPMLPDETTVHTVIANRIYELPLTKLREGLAHGEQNSTDAIRSDAETLTPPQSTPIPLKLCSDLSISLISDDENENDGKTPDELARLSAEKLRMQQPQLSVQQLQIVTPSSSSTRLPPKRRKLG